MQYICIDDDTVCRLFFSPSTINCIFFIRFVKQMKHQMFVFCSCYFIRLILKYCLPTRRSFFTFRNLSFLLILSSIVGILMNTMIFTANKLIIMILIQILVKMKKKYRQEDTDRDDDGKFCFLRVMPFSLINLSTVLV